MNVLDALKVTRVVCIKFYNLNAIIAAIALDSLLSAISVLGSKTEYSLSFVVIHQLPRP